MAIFKSGGSAASFGSETWHTLEQEGSSISPQLTLTVLNIRQKVAQQRPDPHRLLRIPASIESEHCDPCGDLVKGQQRIFKHLSGGNGGSEGAHRIWSNCAQCSHRHPSRTMREPHNAGKTQSSRREWEEVTRPSDRLSDLRHSRSAPAFPLSGADEAVRRV